MEFARKARTSWEHMYERRYPRTDQQRCQKTIYPRDHRSLRAHRLSTRGRGMRVLI